eukprot:jgi/Hompol1/6067/HPOL_004862-RA
MTLLSFFGNLLTAFGPALAVLALYIGRSPQLFMMSLASAFFWLVSMLVISIIVYIAPSINSGNRIPLVVLSSAIQELVRYANFAVFHKADPMMQATSDHPKSPFHHVQQGFSAGFGFGVCSALITFIKPLVESISPGIIECQSCPGSDVFFVGAITTSLFICLHTTWSLIAFTGWYKKQWLPFVWVCISHILASLGTLLIPSNFTNGCVVSIMIQFVILLVNTAYSVWLIPRKIKTN